MEVTAAYSWPAMRSVTGSVLKVFASCQAIRADQPPDDTLAYGIEDHSQFHEKSQARNATCCNYDLATSSTQNRFSGSVSALLSCPDSEQHDEASDRGPRTKCIDHRG